MTNGDAAKAAQLIGYGLQSRLRPAPDSDYRALLDRYQTDERFADLVESVAESMWLHVQRPTPLGLVLAGDPDGPFAVNMDNCGLPLRSGAEDRRIDRLSFALVLTALAAFAYPRGENLIEATASTVRAEELERFITAQAKIAAEAADDAGDDLDVHLSEAAAAWLEMPELRPAQRGGQRSGCRRFYATRILSFLVETGRARREPALDDVRGEVFVLNDRFRAGLAETAETTVARLYAAAASAGNDSDGEA